MAIESTKLDSLTLVDAVVGNVVTLDGRARFM